jgi:hypothetical protein
VAALRRPPQCGQRSTVVAHVLMNAAQLRWRSDASRRAREQVSVDFGQSCGAISRRFSSDMNSSSC